MKCPQIITMSLRSAIVALIGSVSVAEVVAAENWYPYDTEVWHSPFDIDSKRSLKPYSPLKSATKPWDICVSLPHVDDAYWLAINYGIVAESRRLGTKMHLLEAGGYSNLTRQIAQVEDCIDSDADAIVLGAISFEGLNDVIAKAKQHNIPVIDVANGVSSTKVTAKTLISISDLGLNTGRYLADRHPQGSKSVKVAWFPGPPGAGWVESADKGFISGLDGNRSIDVVETRYGDIDKKTQMKQIESVLANHPDLDYIVGTAVAAEASIQLLKEKKLSDQVKTVSYYYTPAVHQAIKRGEVLAATTDSTVIQGRVAIDQAVRILEGRSYDIHVAPKLFVVDAGNIGGLDETSMLAPVDFRATFRVNNK
ncbi:monosaccharide ABC transporter substrate-binding protein (CUT2 family) [Sinobacterium caligoides]|uniref:Monosaccharide ABC transporter substrate-binding protein (CUT2 family) n=1 Tax=Sinobacterium caligoides TaxID=933926 RepID=A0A3N2DK60_9GAMM|nr:TMAO reductase system periplasmic protein TorT [Sinobacterium caligoides]ROS00158.1 monosaccharide ABC transporter substrate-binding protein (CUT2 family) [Sinobacterium caligoides]